MLQSIRYNFAHLFDFSGRDARQTFWFWMLFVVLLNIVASLVISVPMTMGAVSEGVDAARAGNEAAVQAAVLDRMGGMAQTLIWVSVAVGIVNIVLVAAAFVRRLHDSGKSALWAAIAGLAHVAALVLALDQVGDAEAMIRQAATATSAQEAMATQAQFGWQAILGWLPLILIVVFGLMKSDEGANRYGEAPVRT
jgi:uncharacterized membrane protein YhaH (DUF805 family)